MCTVSIIPLRFAAHRGHEPIHGFRLVTNRDESRTRPAATPPRWHAIGAEQTGSARALFPTDAAAGGTWVAVTDTGLALCLLNGNPRPYPALPPPERLMSRGAIVPRLAGVRDAQQAAAAVERLDLDGFAPFALLAVDLLGGHGIGSGGEPRVYRVQWDRRRLECSEYPGAPVCAVSSGLGDELVQPRIRLFEQLMRDDGPRAEAQDRFHRHVWRGRPEISVMMSRTDARTVSVTTVEVVAARHASPARISMHYQPIRESGEYGDPVVHRTALSAGVSGRVRVPIVAG